MIEVVVVLILLAILTPFVVSRFSTSDADRIAQAEIVKSHLRFAQIKAMGDTLQNNNPRWEIEIASATTYTLYRRDDAGTRVAVNLPGETPPSPTHRLPGGINITSGVGTVVAFDDWGSPGVATINLEISQAGQKSTITVTKNTGFIL